MKTAVITGASGGIGQALTDEFLSLGYAVAAVYHKNEKAAKALAEKGAKVFKADLLNIESIKETAAKILKEFHNIDILINNAGVSQFGLFSDCENEEISNLIDINLKGTMLFTKMFIPGMVEQKSGKIINIGSIWGEAGASCEAVYSASKAGLIGFTKALARELGPSGITVNCINPGFFDTEMNSRLSCAERDSFICGTSLGRAGKPCEVAYLASFLAGEKANYITGQCIGIDGGY